MSRRAALGTGPICLPKLAGAISYRCGEALTWTVPAVTRAPYTGIRALESSRQVPERRSNDCLYTGDATLGTPPSSLVSSSANKRLTSAWAR